MRTAMLSSATTALLLLVLGSVRAEEPPPAPEPPPCRHAELDRIAFLEGRWEVVSRQRVDSDGDRWEEARAESTWRPILGGCALEEQWSGVDDGRPLQWIQWLAYDHREGTWQQVMIDSAHGNVITAEGHFADGRLIFHVPHRRRGKLLIDRTTIAATSDDRVEWTMETSADGGKTWTTFWVLRYSRR